MKEPIAIVGLACRFPGAPDAEAFWRLLVDGVDAVTEMPADRMSGWTAAIHQPATPRYGAFLESIDEFDAPFFDLTAQEACSMDPQQRLLLEVAWEALEDAGQPAADLQGTKSGVFVGAMNPDHLLLHANDLQRLDAQRGLGSALGITANRIWYALDLNGPSVVTDTQCSSSLVAVHLACQSLLADDSSPIALAGGVNVILHPGSQAFYEAAGLNAPDGRCKAFDARANGIVRGEGVGLVVLKRLSTARADGDRIYAVIRGSAINHDGRSNGLTAPSRRAQESLLRAAYLRAGISPGSVQYVEAHGTGTLIGDPIEASALGAVMSSGRPPEGRCSIGSVKTNFGHLESAAGIAGLIKTALAMHHGQIPPSLHFKTPNPYIPFAELRLRVQNALGPWPAASEPRRAGVSSFGLGGANAHVVLEEPPARSSRVAAAARPSDCEWALPLSARSRSSLSRLAGRMHDRLSRSNEGELGDICFSAAVRRSHLKHRLVVLGRSREEFVRRLADARDGETSPEIITGRSELGTRADVAFVFSGAGAHWAGMGRELYQDEPVFHNALLEVDHAISAVAGWSPIDELGRDDAESRFERTEIVQPVVFSIQIGLAAWWRSVGLRPGLIVGHSFGEIAAAQIAGVLSLEDAARVSVERSRLLAGAGGRMISVSLSADAAMALPAVRAQEVVIACFNGPDSTVLAGDGGSLESTGMSLDRRGVQWRWINAAVASHTPRVDDRARALARLLADLAPRPEIVPIFSSVTGDRISGTSMDATYWGRTMSSPVRFTQAMEHVVERGPCLVLEISPSPILLSAIDPLLEAAKCIGIPTMMRGPGERRSLMSSAARVHVSGVDIDLGALQAGDAQFVPIPRYPWARHRYAIEAVAPNPAGSDDGQAPIYRIAWRRAPLPLSAERRSGGTWLVVGGEGGVGAAIARALNPERQEVRIVSRSQCIEGLADDALALHGVIDLSALDVSNDVASPDGYESALGLSIGALTLAQAITGLGRARAPRLWLVTRRAQRVTGAGLDPRTRVQVHHAPLLGLGRTFAQELPELWGGLIDLDDASSIDEDAAFIASEILRAPFGIRGRIEGRSALAPTPGSSRAIQ